MNKEQYELLVEMLMKNAELFLDPKKDLLDFDVGLEVVDRLIELSVNKEKILGLPSTTKLQLELDWEEMSEEIKQAVENVFEQIDIDE